MDRLEQARELLREAETRLRAVLAETASTGDYETILQLTRWAQSIAAMASEGSNSPSCFQGASCPNGGTIPVGFQGRAIARCDEARIPPSVKSATQRRHKASRKRLKSSPYPKFARWKDHLVKIGWSRRAKKEYQHKAPRRVVDCLISRLVEIAENSCMFTTEDLLPLRDPSDNTEIPTYQVYVCLAWLRHEGLIEQNGRQGYRIVQPIHFQEAVNRQWEAIPPIETLGGMANNGREN